ncbi:MAG: alpha/beta fold hydrolase, partial [Anaerolineae bacterium]|nr:alpha/beta fold hydrolase [Anaerolineae bacterium]NIN98551.1 alpha/beta fold hydrolase [Anaerolineae bacterium]NIQ81444.1 alpha/beta fold hydrolase [Anaerolineae bacterium]
VAIVFLTLMLFVLLVLGLVAWCWSTELIKSPEPDQPSSPTEYGLPFTEVLFSSQDGLTLHGWFIPAQGVTGFSPEDDDWATGSRGTVVFGHGRFGSKDPDLKYAPWFREAGYNSFLFDFRGHGRSEGNYTSFGFHERKDLLGAIDFLRSKGISSVGVMGFSLGAAVGISTAAVCEDIQAVIADGTFVALRGALARGARERGVPSWVVRWLGAFILWLAGRRVGGDLEESEPIRWVSEIAPRALFLIHGERDRYISTEDVRRLYEMAGEPKELWIVPDAEHRRAHELYPEEYRRRVLGFFDRYLTPASGENRS